MMRFITHDGNVYHYIKTLSTSSLTPFLPQSTSLIPKQIRLIIISIPPNKTPCAVVGQVDVFEKGREEARGRAWGDRREERSEKRRKRREEKEE